MKDLLRNDVLNWQKVVNQDGTHRQCAQGIELGFKVAAG
jgi:hypothetical protein